MKTYNPALFKFKRQILGLTSDELARECFVSRQTISAIENGRNKSKSMILLIGLVLDIKASEKPETIQELREAFNECISLN